MKRLSFLVMSVLLPTMVLATASSCKSKTTETEQNAVNSDSLAVVTSNEEDEPEAVGTLTLYLATEDFQAKSFWGNEDYPAGMVDFKKGYYFQSKRGDVDYSVSDYNDKLYRVEADVFSGESVLYLIPKDKISMETYTINQLPVSMIGRELTFVSKDGNVARIFKSDSNGHKFYAEDGSIDATYNNCYVFQLKSKFEGKVRFEEIPLTEQEGFIELYNNERYPDDSSIMGIRSGDWHPKDFDCSYSYSFYSEDGKLLYDQVYSRDEIDDRWMNIAYIASIDALYIDGALYYRKK